VILENGRFVIDDFVALDGATPLSRLSNGYSQCKGVSGLTPRLTENSECYYWVLFKFSWQLKSKGPD